MNVYDFDNTIYDGESALDFFLCYMKEHPAWIRFLPKVLFAVLRYKRGKITIEQMLTDYAPYIQKIFCSYEDWEAFTVRFWDGHMNKIKSFYQNVRKEDDIILTASPEMTIKEAADRLGIRNIVCSKIDPKTGEITRLCMRENKILALKEDFGDINIEDFYTDSMENDGFFAEHAQRVFLVKGQRVKQIK